MDVKGLVLLMIVLVNVVCITLITATQEDADSFNQVSNLLMFLLCHILNKLLIYFRIVIPNYFVDNFNEM